MGTFFFFLMFISLLGIIPFSVMFFVQLARKKRKAYLGFSALGCITGTIVFAIIGGLLTPTCNHEFKKTNTVVATCVDKGYAEYECTKCGIHRKDDYTEPLGHDIEAKREKEPTETEEGKAVAYCKRCGEVLATRAIPKKEPLISEPITEVQTEPATTAKPTEPPKPTEKPKIQEDKKESKTEEKPKATAEPEKTEEQIIQEYKNSCSKISYEELARNPEKHKGEHLYFKGQVFQVKEPSLFESKTSILVSVTPKNYEYFDETFWEDNVYFSIKLDDKADRILEGDIIEIWGECIGSQKYYNVLGAKTSLPGVDIKYYKISNN